VIPSAYAATLLGDDPGLRTIVIVGGSGFVGRKLATELARRTEPVRCGVRSPKGQTKVSPEGVVEQQADIRDYNSLVALFRGATSVVNLATTTRQINPQTFHDTFFRGTHNLVAAMRAAGVRRLIHVGVVATDRYRRDPRFPYLYWKQRATDLVCASGLDYTVFETSLIFGRGDQLLTAVALALKALPVVPIAGHLAAHTRFQPVSVQDVVYCLAQSLDDRTTIGRCYSLTGPEAYEFIDLARIVDAFLGTKRRIVIVPPWPVRLLLRAGSALMRRPPITTEMLDLAGIDSCCDSRLTYEHFGLYPRCVADSLDYLRSVGAQDFRAWMWGSLRGQAGSSLWE